MSHARGPGAAPPISLPEPLPKLLRDLVHERLGLYFDETRLEAMMEKLAPLAAARQVSSYLDYYYLLKYEPQAEEEWRKVMDAFSVQETYFWREYDQIQALVRQVVPAWFASSARPLRIWSAACASGEEPYSIAMALCEAGWGAHPIEIHASDASGSALAKAAAGVYRERSFRSLPPLLRRTYFNSTGGDGGELRSDIRERVQFRWANLLEPRSYADLGECQVIFCRNVFIYFSTEAIARVAQHLSERLPTGGSLFIGASESLLRLTNAFELEEMGDAFVYRRTTNR